MAPEIPGRFDSFRVVEAYRQTALERGGEVPETYEWAHEIAGRIETKRSAERPVPCHNDLLNANFLDDGERLRIVDWEYAGMGDRFFDLANFSINHELDSAQSAALLAAYFGEARQADLEALELMRFMSDFREAMWGVVQSAVSELDFDFASLRHASTSRDSARTAASPAFLAALGLKRERRLPAPLATTHARDRGYASVGSANFPACSSSRRSSSSSVPMRTGPLNHLLADNTHHPPNRSSAPPTRIGA